MLPMQIFKAGRHTAASGITLEFSESDLDASIAAYDPKVHEAPMVVGHPRDNGPAYGWVQSLGKDGEAMVATTNQVDPEFSEMVKAGRFKHRSASFYAPDAPNNPVPGVYYLRHVGFLGAQPPAVKGLKAVEFSDDEAGIVEFDEYANANIVSMLFRRLRDFLIGDKGLEVADTILPDWQVGALEQQAARPDSDELATPSNFNEPGTKPITEEPPMTLTPEQIAALQAKAATADTLTARVTELEGQTASFAEREKALATRESDAVKATVTARLEALAKTGKILPREVASLANFAASLDDKAVTFDFGEGDKAVKVSARESYFLQLEARTPAVDFSERANRGTTPAGDDGQDAAQHADAIRAYRANAEKEGRTVSFSEASEAVIKQSKAS